MAEGDVEFGHVVDLTLGEPSGTELVADAAIGATTLTVDYAGDFEDVGEVSLNGVTLAYTSIAYGAAETDPDVITLAAPLAAAALTDDKVVRVSGGEEMSDWLLHVSLGDGHPVDIPIPFEQRALWSNVDPTTPVPVMVSADLERLVEVPGRTPTVDGALVDASTLDVTTLPPVSDGDAPTAATTVTPIGGIGSMFYRWTEVDNADPVTYRLYVRAGASPAAPSLLATNLSTNPSFETGVTGWTTVSGSTAPVASTDHAWVGIQSLKAQRGAGTNATIVRRSLGALLPGAGTYRVAVHVWVDPVITGNAGIRLQGTGVGTTQNAYTTVRSGWDEQAITFTWDGTGTALLDVVDASITAGALVYVDGVILTAGATVVPFFHGDTPDTTSIQYDWTSTANASTSTMSSLTLNPAYEVAAGVGLTSASVRKLADGTAIVGDGSVTYHAIVSVEDADGPGPASADVTGIPAQVTGPDVAAGAVTTDKLIFNDGWGINLTGETITGATLQTRATTDRGIKLGQVSGATNYDEAFIVFNQSGVPFIKAVPSEELAVIAGEVKMTTGTVSDGASLGGITEITRATDGTAGALRLTGYTTAPKSAPTVTSGYDTTQFIDDGKWPNRSGWATDGTYWYTARVETANAKVEKWSAAGVLQATGTALFGVAETAGCVVTGGNVYVLLNGQAGWVVARFTAATLAFDMYALWSHADGVSLPALGVDAGTGDLLIAQARPSDVTVPNRVRIRRYTMPAVSGDPLVAGTSVDTAFAFAQDLVGVLYGTHDLGANRYIFANRLGGNYRVVNTTGAAVDAEDWQSGMGAKVGFAYTGGAFVSMDQNGLMRTYTGQDKTTLIGDPSLTKWVSNDLSTATLHTDQSPRAKVIPWKRSKLNVTTSAINTGGTNAPDRVRIFVGQGAADPGRTAMWKQTDPAVGVISASYASLATSGTNPVTPNGFIGSGGTIQRLELADGSAFIDGSGNGAVPAGTFRDSVDARANAMSAARMQAGTASSGTVVAATAKVVTVTFPVAFSSAPKVALTDLNSDPGVDRRTAVVPGSETTTQFQVAFWRATGTASFDVNWLAVKP